MDMKKILQALDGASTKPVEGSNDMKSFMQIVEGKGPLNRPTTAESLTMQHYTETKKTITAPVLNVAEDAKPSMIGKYFKAVETELAEAADRNKDRARQLAERVSTKVAEGERTMSRAAKGHEKYGKEGMAALAKAGRDGASEEKLDKIRDKHDKYNEGVAGPEKCWPGHRKVGTKPGTGKNAGKRVNDCEKIGEQYSYRDIAEMARQGLSNEEIAEQLGFDLTEGLKDPKDNPCWKGYKPVGTKKKGGRTVPNCVPKE